VLAFLDERRPGLALAELRRLFDRNSAAASVSIKAFIPSPRQE